MAAVQTPEPTQTPQEDEEKPMTFTGILASVAIALAAYSTVQSYFLWQEVEALWKAHTDLLTYVRPEDE
jgi:hypothetical protein